MRPSVPHTCCATTRGSRRWDWCASSQRTTGVGCLASTCSAPRTGTGSFVPRMIASSEPGHVVNTGSGGSFRSAAVIAVYSATKHAILGITDALRDEVVEYDIDVSLVCPGGVNTSI